MNANPYTLILNKTFTIHEKPIQTAGGPGHAYRLLH
jgi:hypothetical protein